MSMSKKNQIYILLLCFCCWWIWYFIHLSFLSRECLMVLYVYVLQIVDLFITDDKPSYNGFNAIKVPFVLLTSRRSFFFCYQWDFSSPYGVLVYIIWLMKNLNITWSWLKINRCCNTSTGTFLILQWFY